METSLPRASSQGSAGLSVPILPASLLNLCSASCSGHGEVCIIAKGVGRLEGKYDTQRKSAQISHVVTHTTVCQCTERVSKDLRVGSSQPSRGGYPNSAANLCCHRFLSKLMSCGRRGRSLLIQRPGNNLTVQCILLSRYPLLLVGHTGDLSSKRACQTPFSFQVKYNDGVRIHSVSKKCLAYSCFF